MVLGIQSLQGQSKWLFQTTEIFNARSLGYSTTRIPALLLTRRGTLLAFCEGRVSSASDFASMDILLKRSTDGGNHWSGPVVIAQRDTVGRPTTNSVPIADRNGAIHFLYERNLHSAHFYYIKSTDDGVSWSAPRDITAVIDRFKPKYDWKVAAPGPGHGIQLKSGRLLVPIWLCNPDPSIPGGAQRPSCVATLYSDDHGSTWECGDIVTDNGDPVAGSTDTVVNPSESVLVELSDGTIMMNLRSESAGHRRLVLYSPDGISHWSKPVFDSRLFEPICMASMVRMDGFPGTDYLLFCNPDSRDDPASQHLPSGKSGKRENLTLRLSYDAGKSWPVAKVIDPGPSSYSDMALAKDGTVYILYEHVSGFGWWTPQIMLARLNLSWLTDGRSDY